MRPTNKSVDQESRSFIERARRAQIVEAATATIAELGYGHASFARIAERAGISPGLISYHFNGKHELIQQVVEQFVGGMREAIEARTRAATSYRGVLREMIRAQVRYFADHRTETLAVGAVYAATRGNVADENYGAVDQQRSLSQLEEFFTEAQQAGEFRSFPPRLMASALLAALEAVPRELFRDTGDHAHPDADEYGTELATVFELAVIRPEREESDDRDRESRNTRC